MNRLTHLALLPVAALVMGFQDAGEIEIEPVPPPAELRSEAFVAAQYAQISAAAAAVDKVTARFSAGGGELALLEQQRDEKLAELQAVDRQFTALIERGDQVSEEQRRELAERRRAIREDVTAIEERINTEFPQYFELTRPKPLDVAQAQALLNDDEALLMVLVADDASYVWGVTRDKADWIRSEKMNEKALAAAVAKLRSSMGVKDTRSGAPVDLSGGQQETDAGTLTTYAAQPFDRKLAYEIYSELIAPLQDTIGGKDVLLTNVSGALTALPLGLLVTESPEGADNDPNALRRTGWLIDTYALAELPSVSSLRALRCLLIARKEDAHPGCATASGSDNYARSSRGGVSLAGYGAPTLRGEPGDTDNDTDPGDAYDGQLADTEALRSLSKLPHAKLELESLGKTFGSAAKIVTGDEATESAVKASKEIASARFIVFSTHGLLATEVGDVAEPGLVFTPPAPDAKSEQDDGLLTASEAATLDLAADLVVLSACNTAAGSGEPGAEGLSGLARAFLFAGARSLMVSHWAVSDEATSLLMQTTFRQLESGDIASRARALQTAMQQVRNTSDGSFVNPVFWAPFSLVGEPGA
ncbi:CHAT domain-containing protein [Pseudoblastomonas halimionae]|uniref:CHAT domain-containing protein n=1 Tax=Alteriqipengyuania halimionae TaxID=1926630 RepID=A0A6I4U619_9SPHN|nr:CHAT domain-containing protein [Alteriqipengyuania halimionae]MXP09891.1 CHAT domain-containing protein [Alteriqipengyuania halimionae]